MLNIAFDLDGILVDLYTQLKLRLKSDNINLLENNNYKLRTNPLISNKTLWKYIGWCYSDYKNAPIFPGVEKLFDNLYAKGKEPIKIVTSRPGTWAATETIKLVNSFTKVPTIVCFANSPWKKNHYLSNIDYFVEDRRKIVKELIKYDKKVFVPHRSYNKIDGYNINLYRYNNLFEIIRYIKLNSNLFIK